MQTNSEEFLSVLTWVGSASSHCGCGREHVAINNDDWDEEEKKLFISNAEKSNTFFVHEVEEIHTAEIANMRFVDVCSCNQLLLLEKFVWQGRKEILQYYGLIQSKMERENASMKQILANFNDRFKNNVKQFDA